MGRYKNHDVFKYPEEALYKALQAIREDNMGIRGASRKYGVPRGTIQDRLHGRVKEAPRRMGPATVLTQDEETHLENWLTELAKCGFPQKKNDLFTSVQKIVSAKNKKTPFKQNRPGEKWYRAFIRRHPKLSLREAEGLTKARSIITEESIKKWFRELKQFLEESQVLDILEDPSRIFNGDETSFSMCPKSGKVLAPKGYKNIYEVKKGNEKETITVLLVFSADGRTLTPMVVFPFVRPNKAIVDSIPSGWFLGRSESGWMRSDTFYEYIANGLNKWLNENKVTRPILLLVDGHKSHLSVELSQFCHERGIILYALPPNTTHIMQPADVSVFKPLKTNWKKTVRQWQAKPENVNCVLTKCTFCPLLEQVLQDESLPQTIQNGFRKCGLFPFNPEAVDYSKCIQNRLERLNHQDNIQKSDVTAQQFETTETVLTTFKESLLERGIENVQNIIEQLQSIKQELYPRVETFQVLADGTLNMVDNNVIPESHQSVCTNDIIEFEFKEFPNMWIGEENNNLNSQVISEATHESEQIFDEGEKIRILQDITIPNTNLANTTNPINTNKSEDNTLSRQLINEGTHESEQKFDEGEKIRILQDITIPNTNLDNTTNPTDTNKSENKDSIDKHLFFPSPIIEGKRKIQDRLPAAISSDAFREHLKQKLEIKQKEAHEKEKRKQERLERAKQKKISAPKKKRINKHIAMNKDSEQKKISAPKKKRTNKNIDTNKDIATSSALSKADVINEKKQDSSKDTTKDTKMNEPLSDSEMKEVCARCEFYLKDTDDPTLQIVGCNRCLRWYHLECITFEEEPFICSLCAPKQNNNNNRQLAKTT
jgi:hypothetical protein